MNLLCEKERAREREREREIASTSGGALVAEGPLSPKEEERARNSTRRETSPFTMWLGRNWVCSSRQKLAGVLVLLLSLRRRNGLQLQGRGCVVQGCSRPREKLVVADKRNSVGSDHGSAATGVLIETTSESGMCQRYMKLKSFGCPSV